MTHKKYYDGSIPWFPKYVNLKNGYDDDLWVLRDIIDNHTAYYWKVSGEWGRKIKYDGLTYQVQCPNGQWVYNEYLIAATPEEFLKNNPQLATNWSKDACIDAWEEVKETNPLAKEQLWDCSGKYWYHDEKYYNNKFANWTI